VPFPRCGIPLFFSRSLASSPLGAVPFSSSLVGLRRGPSPTFFFFVAEVERQCLEQFYFSFCAVAGEGQPLFPFLFFLFPTGTGRGADEKSASLGVESFFFFSAEIHAPLSSPAGLAFLSSPPVGVGFLLLGERIFFARGRIGSPSPLADFLLLRFAHLSAAPPPLGFLFPFFFSSRLREMAFETPLPASFF